MGTFILDCVYFASFKTSVPAKALTGVVLVAKIAAMYLYLQHPKATIARKYIIRRCMVFCLTKQTSNRRLNRSIRSRILALGWIELIGICLYLAMFLMAITLFSNTTTVSIPVFSITIWQFLLLKIASSLLVLLVLLRDADLTLALAHFGIFGCHMSHVRRYFHKRERKLNDTPLPYKVNEDHFNMLCFIKLIDFAWGIVGWITLSPLFGAPFASARTDLKAFVAVTGFALALTDIWAVVLFGFVKQLFVNRGLLVMQGDDPNDSDDSELHELRIRDDLEDSMDKRGVGVKWRERMEADAEEESGEADEEDGDDLDVIDEEVTH